MSQEIANRLAQEYFEITNIECSANEISWAEQNISTYQKSGVVIQNNDKLKTHN